MDDEPSCGSKAAEIPARVVTKNGPCINFKKCQAAKSFAVSRQRLMCRPCYADAVLHQFRKGLQLVKPTKRSGVTPLVVGFSGGTCSSALLQMLAKLQDQDARKVHFSSHVVWVDCLDVLPVAAEEKVRLREAIPARVAALGFQSFKRIPVCAAFSKGSLEPDEKGATLQQLQRVFEGTHPQVSWKEELLEVLIRSLLVRYAQRVQSHRIVTAESMTRVGVNLFANLSRGVGANAAAVVGAVDAASFGGLNVMLVRPLVSLTTKELGLYLEAVGATHSTLVVATFSTLAKDQKHSLKLLSESFLLTLQDAHDHTLPTLLRAANKIEVPPHTYLAKEWAHCMGCDPQLKRSIQEQPAQDGTLRCSLCLLVAPMPQKGAECCEGGCGCGAAPPRLCRKCALVTQEIEAANGASAAEVIPLYRDTIREQIAEYLLSDSEDE